MNLSDILLILALALILFGVIRKMILNKKAGKTSCGCGCSSCPHSASCHKKPEA